MNDTPIKRANADDVMALGQLSDRVFRPKLPAGTAMPVEFAPMFSAQNARNLYFVANFDRPVSLVGTMPAKVHVHGVSVSVVSIGSVCTLEEFRKHHYASQMVEQVIRDFSSTTSVMLVSGDLSIYRRVGCADFGDWLGATIGPVDTVTELDVSVFEGLVDPVAAHQLYLGESLRFSRTVEEMMSLWKTLEAPRFRAKSRPPLVFSAVRAGEVIAYAIAVQSDGHEGIVQLLEWAGDRLAVVHLAEEARRAFGASQVHMSVSRADQTMRSVLGKCHAQWQEKANEGTLRVLNPDLLLNEMGLLIQELFGCTLRLPSIGVDTWRVDWQCEAGGVIPPSQHTVLTGWAELSTWLFAKEGLNLPFARTDDLNYV